MRKYSILLALAIFLMPSLVLADNLSTQYYNFTFDSKYTNLVNGLSPYLSAAYKTPADLLGYYGSSAPCNVIIYSDPSSSTIGYTILGSNEIHLNVGNAGTDAGSLKYDAATLAHETTHVLFNREVGNWWNGSLTKYWNFTYISESLAYYVNESLYQYGPQNGKSTIGANFSYQTYAGKVVLGWQLAGYTYVNANQWPTLLPIAITEFPAIGYFLDHAYGSGKIPGFMGALAQTKDPDSAYKSAFGKVSGQEDEVTGSGVNTLFNDFYYYYFGHY